MEFFLRVVGSARKKERGGSECQKMSGQRPAIYEGYLVGSEERKKQEEKMVERIRC